MRALSMLAALAIALASCGDDDGGSPADASIDDDAADPIDAPSDVEPALDVREPDVGMPDLGAVDAGADLGTDSGVAPPGCDPRLVESCPAGERCALLTEFGLRGRAFFTCRVDPGRGEGEACDFSGVAATGRRPLVRDDCASGLACAWSDGAPGDAHTCRRVCASASDCDEGDVCELLLTASIAADPLPRAGVCRTPTACDALTGMSCPTALFCRAIVTTDGTLATSCREAGDHEEDEGCLDRECGVGLVCAQPVEADGSLRTSSDDTRCVRVCDPASDDCGDGASCITRDGSPFGLCRRDEPEPAGTTERPARVVVPPAHDGATPLPLLLALHGNPGDSTRVDATFRIARMARAHGLYAVLADGTRDTVGSRFWNATPACCDFARLAPDDSSYLRALVDEMTARFPIDPARVWVFGTSNGGFMAHRLACDHADVVTAIVSRAGSTLAEASDCRATRAVSALEIHGTEDANVPYEGGSFPGGAYPGAVETMERWAALAGCDLDATLDGTAFDLDHAVDGDETVPRVWSSGCAAPGIGVELWTLRGSTHFVELAPDGPDRIAAWLAAHPR